MFELGAQLEDSGSYDEYDCQSDTRVSLPILRLGVPTAGRRPNVLRIPVRDESERDLKTHCCQHFLRHLRTASHDGGVRKGQLIVRRVGEVIGFRKKLGELGC